MFPFQRSCELSFKIDDEGDQIEQNSLEDHIMLDNNSSFGLNYSSTSINTEGRGRGYSRGRGRGRRGGRTLIPSLAGASNSNTCNNDEEERKILHREYERQRRQDMASLFNSLRSTLPAELIQGKRSISDHVGEAVSYIQHLKKNVKELEEKKNQLKQSLELPSSSTNYELSELNEAGLRGSSVVPKRSVVGLEIEIDVAFNDQDFTLSSALQLVIDEGFEVVSCTSTTFNGRLIHNLQCQVGNIACIDVDRLQQRLSDLVC